MLKMILKRYTLMQNEQLILKNVLKYKTDSLKQNQKLVCKTTDTNAEKTITDAKSAVIH